MHDSLPTLAQLRLVGLDPYLLKRMSGVTMKQAVEYAQDCWYDLGAAQRIKRAALVELHPERAALFSYIEALDLAELCGVEVEIDEHARYTDVEQLAVNAVRQAAHS